MVFNFKQCLVLLHFLQPLVQIKYVTIMVQLVHNSMQIQKIGKYIEGKAGKSNFTKSPHYSTWVYA